jgi:hypothetical protein
MKSIAEHMKQKEKFGVIVRDIINLDWVFSKGYEKIILLASIVWSIWSLFKFIKGLF